MSSNPVMTKTRLEAFSDAVIAVAITIMVLEIKVPHGDTFSSLVPLIPKFLSYLLSFIYIGIYWNNHHHMLHTLSKVNGRILWANHHLLFWLTLVSFATGWMGENHFTSIPVSIYGVALIMCAIAYVILQNEIIKSQGSDSILKKAVANDWKGKYSPVFYLAGVVLAFWVPYVSLAIYSAVALIWLIPDTRIEKVYS
jgi:uncharacterized membrane protein